MHYENIGVNNIIVVVLIIKLWLVTIRLYLHNKRVPTCTKELPLERDYRSAGLILLSLRIITIGFFFFFYALFASRSRKFNNLICVTAKQCNLRCINLSIITRCC